MITPTVHNGGDAYGTTFAHVAQPPRLDDQLTDFQAAGQVDQLGHCHQLRHMSPPVRVAPERSRGGGQAIGGALCGERAVFSDEANDVQ